MPFAFAGEGAALCHAWLHHLAVWRGALAALQADATTYACGKQACACAASASPCTPGKRPRSPLKDAQLLFGTSESSDDAAVDNVRAQKRYLSEVGDTQTGTLLSAQQCTASKS